MSNQPRKKSTREINALASDAQYAGISLNQFADGEDVTGFRSALNRIVGPGISTNDAMRVIDELARRDEDRKHILSHHRVDEQWRSPDEDAEAGCL